MNEKPSDLLDLFARLLATPDSSQQGLQKAAEELPGLLRAVFQGVKPKRRWQLAKALAQFLRDEAVRHRRTCDDLQIFIAFEFLQALERFDRNDNWCVDQRFAELSKETASTLIDVYTRRSPEALGRLLEAIGKKNGQQLCLEAQRRYLSTIRSGNGLEQLETLLQAGAWLDISSARLFGEAQQPAVQDTRYPWRTQRPPVLSTEAVCRAIQYCARNFLRQRPHLDPADTLALHMLAAEYHHERFASKQNLRELYEGARRSHVRIVVERGNSQRRIWGSPDTVPEQMNRAANWFRNLFGITPEVAAQQFRGVSKAVHFKVDAEDGINLRCGDRFKTVIINLLAGGNINRVENLLRGTAWTGAFVDHLKLTGALSKEPICQPVDLGKVRWLILRFAVVAMWQAHATGNFGIAAALGQMLLHDHDSWKTGSSAIRIVAEDIATEESRVKSVDVVQRAQFLVNHIIAMAMDCYELAIEHDQPIWLGHIV